MNDSTRGSGGEAGVTLAELLIALLVVGIVMAGLVSVTVSTLGVTQVNDARSAATNLAQAEIERLRSLPFADLQIGGREVRTVDEGGRSYDVAIDTTWVGLTSDTDPCAEPDQDPDTSVVRVDVFVSRQDVAGHEVSSTTTIAPPPVNPSVDRGVLTVLVVDHQDPPEPVSFVWVKVVGPTETSGELRTLVTPATGCVLFHDLPQGTYEVSLERAGYVSIGGEPEPTRVTSVAPGTRTPVEFSYAEAGSVQLEAAPRGGLDALQPVSLPVSVSRRDLVARSQRGELIDPAWPGLWEVWAGDCPDADPLGIRVVDEAVDEDEDEDGAGSGDPFWPGAVRQDRFRVPAGGTTVATAELPVVRLVVTGVIFTPANPQPVTVSARATGDDCSSGTSELHFPAAIPTIDGAAGSINLALPYGTWELTATNGAATVTAQGVVLDPREPGIVTVTATPGGGPP